ncbi:MAG: Crp/Fnr family transcriptional regulator [Chromatiales bacterium]
MKKTKTNTELSHAVLRQSAWFKTLPTELQDEILTNSGQRQYSKDEIIFREDQPAIGICAVIAGEVAISRMAGAENECLLHVGGPGMWFGEVAVLSGRDTAVTARALTEAKILVLPPAEFERIVEQEPRYYRPLAMLALQRSQIMLRNIAVSQNLSPEQYLRLRLADLAEMRMSEHDLDNAVELNLSQTQLAQMIGASRQTVNALLKALESDGLIRAKFRKIVISDIDGLRGERRRTGL